MTCSNNFIGIKALENTEGFVKPKSGLFIEQLEGISFNRLAEIEYGKHQSAIELFETKLDSACRMVVDDAVPYIEPFFRINSFMDYGVVGEFDEVGDNTAGDCGIRIEKFDNRFSQLYIPHVFVKVATSLAGAELKITDGNESQTVQFDAVADESVLVELNFTSTSNYVEITIDNTLEPWVGDISNCSQMKSCATCQNAGRFEYLKATGISPNGADNKNYGIKAEAVVNCEMERASCLIVSRLKYAVLYRLGVELLKEWMASDRLNFMTIHGKQWAEMKLQEWEEIDYKNHFINHAQSLAHFLKQVDCHCFAKTGNTYGHLHP